MNINTTIPVSACRLRRIFMATLLFCTFQLGAGAEETMVQFTYSGTDAVFLTIRSVEADSHDVSLMLGGEYESVEIPLSPGRYELGKRRITDIADAAVQPITVKPGPAQAFTVESVGFSPHYELEELRSSYARAVATEKAVEYRRESFKIAGWLAVGAGALTGAGAATLYFIGRGVYDDYMNAATTAEAAELRTRALTSAGITIGLAGATGAGLLSGLIAHIAAPNTKEFRQERQELQLQLKQMELEAEGFEPSGKNEEKDEEGDDAEQ